MNDTNRPQTINDLYKIIEEVLKKDIRSLRIKGAILIETVKDDKEAIDNYWYRISKLDSEIRELENLAKEYKLIK